VLILAPPKRQSAPPALPVSRGAVAYSATAPAIERPQAGYVEPAVVVELDDDEDTAMLDVDDGETVTRSALTSPLAPVPFTPPASHAPPRVHAVAAPAPARVPFAVPQAYAAAGYPSHGHAARAPQGYPSPQSFSASQVFAAHPSYTPPSIPPRSHAAHASAFGAPVSRTAAALSALPAPYASPPRPEQAPYGAPHLSVAYAAPPPEVHRRSAPTMPPQNRMQWPGIDPYSGRSTRQPASGRPGRTLSPQVRSTSPYDDDESLFRPRRRGRSWAGLFAFSLVVGASVTFVKLYPQAVPSSVSNAIARARSSTIVQNIESSGSSLLARLPIQHEGRAEPLPQSAPANASHVASTADAPAAPTPPPVAPAPEPAKSANEPPTVSINSLPQAPAPRAAAPLRVRSAPAAAAPSPARAQAVARPARAPARPAPAAAEEQPVAVKAKPAPAPPPPPAAPPPAPGSLDDLIRKAVAADAKKKH
jgi:hypothetical protein